MTNVWFTVLSCINGRGWVYAYIGSLNEWISPWYMLLLCIYIWTFSHISAHTAWSVYVLNVFFMFCLLQWHDLLCYDLCDSGDYYFVPSWSTGSEWVTRKLHLQSVLKQTKNVLRKQKKQYPAWLLGLTVVCNIFLARVQFLCMHPPLHFLNCL